MRVKCPYCGYSWNYHGSDKNYATCKCGKHVRLHPYRHNGYKPLLKLSHKFRNYTWGTSEKVQFT